MSICRSQKGNSVNFKIDQSKRELAEWLVKQEISVSCKTVIFDISILSITCGQYNTSDYNIDHDFLNYFG